MLAGCCCECLHHVKVNVRMPAHEPIFDCHRDITWHQCTKSPFTDLGAVLSTLGSAGSIATYHSIYVQYFILCAGPTLCRIQTMDSKCFSFGSTMLAWLTTRPSMLCSPGDWSMTLMSVSNKGSWQMESGNVARWHSDQFVLLLRRCFVSRAFSLQMQC